MKKTHSIALLILNSTLFINCSGTPKDSISESIPILFLATNRSATLSASSTTNMISVATVPTTISFSNSNLNSTTGAYTGVVGTILNIDNITNIVNGATSVFSISPRLPNGLLFNTTTGSISGTPTVSLVETIYTISANYTASIGFQLNNSNPVTTAIKITVQGLATLPSLLTYSSTNSASTNGNIIVPLGTSVTISNSASTVTGATVAYSVSPALPTGLVLNTSTGSIIGTPITSQTLTNYLVTATYTAQTGFQLNSLAPLTSIIRIYVNDATTINNLTCNLNGIAAGCTVGNPFSCTNSVSCYVSATSCYSAVSACIR